MATQKRGSKSAHEAKPNVVVFRLDDITAAQHALPLFQLPEAVRVAPFYAHDIAAKGKSKLFTRIRETKLPSDVVKRGFALTDAILGLITGGDESPIGDDPWSRGFHPDATFEQMVASFEEDGYAVITIADLRARHVAPRDVARSRKRLARAAKSLAKDLGAPVVARVVAWIEEGGAEPEVPTAMVAPLAALVLDEAIETWGPIEDRVFSLAARHRAIPTLAEHEDREGAGVDRWTMLSARLAQAGWSEDEIERAWIDGLLGERDWTSATWFAASFAPKLEAIVRRILARRDEVDPSHALIHVLAEPMEGLPAEIEPLYKAAVRDVVTKSDIAGSIGDDVWERLVGCDEKAFAKAEKAAKKAGTRVVAPLPLAMGTSPKLATIQDRVGLSFPDEVLEVWDLASSISPKNPSVAFAQIDDLGISLVGPFDLLAGRTRVKKGLDVRLHYRYRLDPPEFATVAVGNVDRLHFGYWYDDPAEGPACVASYYAGDAYEISVPGRTLWETIRRSIEAACAGAADNFGDEPEHFDAYARTFAQLAIVRERVMKYATGDRPEIGDMYLKKYELRAWRRRQVIAESPEGMGIVAPAERYKPLSVASHEMAKALHGKMSRKRLVKEAIGLAEEGYPVGALVAGRWCWARGLDEEAYALLDAAYAGLARPKLQEVLAVHRAHRDLASVDVLVR